MFEYATSENVLRIRRGTPLETDAIDRGVPFTISHTRSQPDLSPLAVDPSDPQSWRVRLFEPDVVFGLGQAMRSMNKRGGIYEAWCFDESEHTPEKRSLYGAHNLLLLDGGSPERRLAIFVDTPGRVTFDVAATRADELSIRIAEPAYDLYLLRGRSLRAIARAFRRLIGPPYLPPRWALGYHQSRWGYNSAAEVAALATRLREERLPCDAIGLDIEYMQRYKSFTIDSERFPDPQGLAARLRADGIRLVPIVDAGIRIEPGYAVYDEGLAGGHFCSNGDGTPFTAAVWPGLCHFPDFLNPETREWFGSYYRELMQLGIEGFWNDMNEPAIFYTPEVLAQATALAGEASGADLAVNSYFELRDAFALMPQRIDHGAIHHRLGDGRTVGHEQVHNCYGAMMTRAAAEAFRRLSPDRRVLLFSRASTVGAHRDGGLWTGDNASWWEHLLLNVTMLPALNMVGFLYSGADIGGHMLDATGELVTRWTQFAVVVPLMRNHATRDARPQEPFAFDAATTARVRAALELRYALLYWLYGELLWAARENEPLFAPLAFDYPGERARRIEDQLLVGRGVMAAPVYRENARGRYVHLCEPMALWRVQDQRDRDLALLPAGDHWIDVALDEIALFIRPGGVIVLTPPALHEGAIDTDRLEALLFLGDDEIDYELPWDDGITPRAVDAPTGSLRLRVAAGPGGLEISAEAVAPCGSTEIELYVITSTGARLKQRVSIQTLYS